jgi:hypothetical protein
MVVVVGRAKTVKPVRSLLLDTRITNTGVSFPEKGNIQTSLLASTKTNGCHVLQLLPALKIDG